MSAYYELNATGQAEIINWLRANLTGPALEHLDTPDAQGFWFNKAEESINNGWSDDGHIEIKARDSRTGQTLTASFDRDTCFTAIELED